MIYTKLKQFLDLFKLKTRYDELEDYIISKNVTTVAEVDFYTKEFDRKHLVRSVWW
jgi:hypothetical protein